MLNKELLLISSKTIDPHILLTVGYSSIGTADYYRLGDFFGNFFGTVNRRPFWRTPSGDILLSDLYYADSAKETIINSASKVKDNVRVTISTPDNSVIMILAPNAYNKVPGDALNLKANTGKTIPITFDPPPRRIQRSIILKNILRRNP